MPAITVDDTLVLPRIPRPEASCLHDELPTERWYRAGGPAHAVQLWVNLPARLKMTPPRYQSITRDGVRLLTSHDGGALIRLIAGDIVGFTRPGDTQPLDVLVLGGLPIREPIAHDGPFVMNTRGEIIQAIEDYRAGRLGIIPADQSAPRNLAPVDR